MVSQRQKQTYLKFELLEYDKNTKDFEIIDQTVVEQRYMPNGVSNVGGMITANSDQDSRVTLDVQITNHDGMNNWGDDFDSDNPDNFDWWLDKRLNVYIGLRLDDVDDIEYIRMGHFVVTHFKTNHSLTEFPIIEIQGGSKEILYASRKGKFLYDTTIFQNTVMTESIKSILLGNGELEKNIRIDPSIADSSMKLEDGSEINEWNVLFSDTASTLDLLDFAIPESSIRFDVSSNQVGILAEKTFVLPVNMSEMQSLAFIGRCSRDVHNGDISIVFENSDGVIKEYPLLEMAGHVVNANDEPIFVDNWRNVVLATDDMGILNSVVKMKIKINNSSIKAPYSLWVDTVHCADIRNLLPYELTYGAGDSRWSAIKEIAHLLDAIPHYDEYGNFILMKIKFPKERFNNEFDYDAYEVLETKMVYNDQKRYNNLYAGTQDDFNEHELSNHIQVTGGSTYETVMSLVDLQVRLNGIEMREKGKYLNRRGKVRAVDQFYKGADATVFNKDTDVESVYKYHKNQENAMQSYPNGFPQTTEPPIINYAIEKIGDYIYHHNNASPDPVIVYAYEGKNRALFEIRRRLAHAEQLTVLSAPYYTLRLNDIIRVEDSLLELNDNYEIRGLSIPLNGGYMNINAVKVKNLIIDIPYFDNSHPKANACWYGYDMCGLAFTYNYWRTREKPLAEDGKIVIHVRHSGDGRGMSRVFQGNIKLGEGTTKQTGHTITHCFYDIILNPDKPIIIDTKEIGIYSFGGITDGNGNTIGTNLTPQQYYNDMIIDIRFN